MYGQERHTWIMDALELGERPANQYAMERWVGGAARMIAFYEQNRKVDEWMASPEGRAALDTAADEIRSRSSQDAAKGSV